jgi:hypothetical protein
VLSAYDVDGSETGTTVVPIALLEFDGSETGTTVVPIALLEFDGDLLSGDDIDT